MQTQITLVVAHARNRVIGKDNALLWNLPCDMKHFKELTYGSIVVMGRKTWDSLPEKFRPLPNRINVVVTSNVEKLMDYVWELPHSAKTLITPTESVEDFVKWYRERDQYQENGLPALPIPEMFVIGGQSIYEQFLPYANKIVATQIHADFEGDTYFPELPLEEWEVVARVLNPEENGLRSEVVTYRRK